MKITTTKNMFGETCIHFHTNSMKNAISLCVFDEENQQHYHAKYEIFCLGSRKWFYDVERFQTIEQAIERINQFIK